MPLPTPICPGPEVPCCDHFFTIADNILEVAHTAVVSCMVDQNCDPQLEGYVSVGQRINDPASDYLVVSLISIAPPAGSSGKMFIPQFRATYQVRLLETGWPMPNSDDAGIQIPSGDQYSYAARFSFAHGQKMYQALAGALSEGSLNPFCPGGCYQQLTALLPVEPSGGSVGWTCSIVVDADILTPFS